MEKLQLAGSRRGERAAPPGPQRCQAAAQRRMLHCVSALHQFAADRVLQSAGRTLFKVGSRSWSLLRLLGSSNGKKSYLNDLKTSSWTLCGCMHRHTLIVESLTLRL